MYIGSSVLKVLCCISQHNTAAGFGAWPDNRHLSRYSCINGLKISGKLFVIYVTYACEPASLHAWHFLFISKFTYYVLIELDSRSDPVSLTFPEI